MAQKTGALIFDETADRYDIRFDIADYYGGLHCGECMDVFTGGKWNHYVDRSQWQITENVHEPIIDRADFETAQRILENAPVRRPNGDGDRYHCKL